MNTNLIELQMQNNREGERKKSEINTETSVGTV